VRVGFAGRALLATRPEPLGSRKDGMPGLGRSVTIPSVIRLVQSSRFFTTPADMPGYGARATPASAENGTCPLLAAERKTFVRSEHYRS
jgi:hypothetical protein